MIGRHANHAADKQIQISIYKITNRLDRHMKQESHRTKWAFIYARNEFS